MWRYLLLKQTYFPSIAKIPECGGAAVIESRVRFLGALAAHKWTCALIRALALFTVSYDSSIFHCGSMKKFHSWLTLSVSSPPLSPRFPSFLLISILPFLPAFQHFGEGVFFVVGEGEQVGNRGGMRNRLYTVIKVG